MTKKRVKDGYLEIYLEDTQAWVPAFCLIQYEQGLNVALEENQENLLSEIKIAIQESGENTSDSLSQNLKHETLISYPGNNSWYYTSAYKAWFDNLKSPYIYSVANILDINEGVALMRLEFSLNENGPWLPQQGFDTNPDTGEVTNKEIYRSVNLSLAGISPTSFCAEKAQGYFVRIGFKSNKTFRANIQIWSTE